MFSVFIENLSLWSGWFEKVDYTAVLVLDVDVLKPCHY